MNETVVLEEIRTDLKKLRGEVRLIRSLLDERYVTDEVIAEVEQSRKNGNLISHKKVLAEFGL